MEKNRKGVLKMKKKLKFESLYKLKKEILDTNEKINDYLKFHFEIYSKDKNIKKLCSAINTTVKLTIGFTELSKRTGLNRSHLYKILSAHGNPTLDSLNNILNSLNYHIQIVYNDEYKYKQKNNNEYQYLQKNTLNY
jgi:probable addiction module antidote protein